MARNRVGNGRGVGLDTIPKALVELPNSVVSANPAPYNLGKDAFNNMAIGTAWASLTPGITGKDQSGNGGNVSIGSGAMAAETTPFDQVAVGHQALAASVNGSRNVAVGPQAMQNATGGDRNVAIGHNTLQGITGQIFYTTSTTTVNGAGQTISTTPSTLTVASTTGFDAPTGQLYVQGVGALVSYTGTTGTTFTGCTVPSGSYVATNGGQVNVGAGTFNTAVGDEALRNAVVAGQNTAIGSSAGHNLLDGIHCVFVGESAGLAIPHGNYLTIVGADSANNVTSTPTNLTVLGANALQGITSGALADTTAVGINTLQVATTSNQNTAIGSSALVASTTGGQNTAVGYFAGGGLTIGQNNVFVGANAGQKQATSNQNVIIGMGAGNTAGSTDHGGMTLLGYNTTGAADYIVALGDGASVTASGGVAIGVDSGGTGASTSTANEIKLGTSNHTVNIPTTSAVGNGTSTNLTALAKNTGGGPASDVVNAWIPIRNGATSGFIPFFV